MKKVPKTKNPARLSVVIVSPFPGAPLRKCLESIFANENLDQVEIIVADCGAVDLNADLPERYPGVLFIQLPGSTGVPALAEAAFKRSSGEIIALTDASCFVGKTWVSAILKAHLSASPVIGGAVEAGGLLKPLDWAAYFCEYGQFAAPLKSGAVDVLPGNNISFKRETLPSGGDYEKNGFWKTYWCRELQARGVELISEPSISVRYEKQFELSGFLSRRFRHGRCFAGMRTKRMSVFRRLVYAAGSIFLPLVFLYRTVNAVLGKKRFFKKLVLSLPFIVPAIFCWCWGETFGYLAGTGKSCDNIC